MSEVHTGNVAKITNAEESTITTEFTNDGASISKIIDGEGSVYINSFDQNNNLIQTTYPDGENEKFTYDGNGNLNKIISRSKQETSYSLNKRGELLQKTSSDKSITYQYNIEGSLTKAISKDSVVEIAYDKEKRPVKVTYDGQTSLLYEYNSKGQRTSLSDSSGNYKITYHYDEAGRMILAKQEGKKNILSVDYQNGFLKSRRTGDDTRVHYTFNNRTNKLEAMEIVANNSKTGTKFSYTRDKFSRIKTIDQTNKDGSFKWSFSYDRISQLTSFSNSDGVSNDVTYDKNQNRKTLKNNKNGDSVYRVNSLNQMTGVNDDEKLTYDLNGNIIQIENLKKKIDERFVYDSENKMTESLSSSSRCSYAYDALGNIKEQICDGIKTSYLVDPFGKFGADIIGEVS